MTSKYPELDDFKWLHEHYLVKLLSCAKIANLVGVPNDNAATVRNALKRQGIPIRSISEARSKENLPPITYTEKICTRCKNIKPLDQFHLLPAMRDGHASHCKKCAGLLANSAVRDMRLRVVESLGGKCVGPGPSPGNGCGIIDARVLTIDHVNGGGNKERIRTGASWGYYKKMLESPDQFQVLCWNCNHLKRLELGEHRVSTVAGLLLTDEGVKT
jgi:hypothetical protein